MDTMNGEEIALTNGGTVMVINLDASTTNTITIPDAQVSVSGNDLTIDLSSNLGFATNYAVQISTNAVIDVFTNFFLDSFTFVFIKCLFGIKKSVSPTTWASFQ